MNDIYESNTYSLFLDVIVSLLEDLLTLEGGDFQ